MSFKGISHPFQNTQWLEMLFFVIKFHAIELINTRNIVDGILFSMTLK